MTMVKPQHNKFEDLKNREKRMGKGKGGIFRLCCKDYKKKLAKLNIAANQMKKELKNSNTANKIKTIITKKMFSWLMIVSAFPLKIRKKKA